MDSIDAANKFIDKYNLSGVSQSEVKIMIVAEANFLREFHKGRRFRYDDLIERAYENVCESFEHAKGQKVNLTWHGMRYFVGSRRVSCVWATLLSLEVNYTKRG